jgi:hypothetical protein
MMTRRFDAEAVRMAITAAVLLSGPAVVETHSAQPLKGAANEQDPRDCRQRDAFRDARRYAGRARLC